MEQSALRVGGVLVIKGAAERRRLHKLCRLCSIVSGHGLCSAPPLALATEWTDATQTGCQTQPPLRAGLPGISLPCGFDDSSADRPLPVGLQIIGRAFGEADMLKVAHAYEQTAGIAFRHPAGLQ